MRTKEANKTLEILFDESNDDFFDRETDDYPDHVRQFAEKQEKEAKTEKVFAVKVIALMTLAVTAIFFICLTLYN